MIVSFLGFFMEMFCEFTGGIKEMFCGEAKKNDSTLSLFLLSVTCFIPIIIPALAFFGLSEMYTFAKLSMAPTIILYTLYKTEIFEICYYPNKVLLLMELVPSAITLVILLLQWMGYHPMPQMLWKILEFFFVISKFLLLFGVGGKPVK